MRILIVDDDDLALEVLAHTITHAGHEPVYARNGREALASLGQDHVTWSFPTGTCRR